ncbi:MAG: GNAT family N-acetyltransferase [Armatimonadota bacterium]
MAFRVRALQKGELDGLLLCFQSAFGVDDPSIAVVRNSLVNDPYFHPERVRVGVLNGSIISHVVILHRAVYVGSQVITVAGITAVATHPLYQRQGYGHRVMQDALKHIRQQNYDMAMLTTRVPGFFLRLGFREMPKVDGFEAPTSALAVLDADGYTVQPMDYNNDWRAISHIYRLYSAGITGMQVRDARFWETWPRRGTFPHGFSSRLGGIGLIAAKDGQAYAYLAASMTLEQAHLAISDLAHRPGHEDAALQLLRNAAERYLTSGSGRTVMNIGGNSPVIARLKSTGVPVEVEIGPGLMVLIPNRDWIGRAGFRSVDAALDHLFRSEPPVVWHRDGY